MNRIILVLAALSLAVLPALPSVADGPLRLSPCSGKTLTLQGDAFVASMPVDGLLTGNGVTTTYKLDLSGQTVGATQDMKATAMVSASSSWDVVVNDYDLGINGSVSENFQPLDPAEEYVSVNNVQHCATVTVEVINYLGTGGDSVNVQVFVAL